jgi:hypothetical protein
MVGHCAICHCKIALSTPMSITTARSIVCMSSRAVVANDSISLERTTPCTSGSRIWRVAQPRSGHDEVATSNSFEAVSEELLQTPLCHIVALSGMPSRKELVSVNMCAPVQTVASMWKPRGNRKFFRGTALVGGGQARPRCDGCGHYGCECALSRGQWTASVAMGL